MTEIHPQYITDPDGKKLSVVISIEEYQQILGDLDELEDIRLYDEAKSDRTHPIPFDEYLKQRNVN